MLIRYGYEIAVNCAQPVSGRLPTNAFVYARCGERWGGNEPNPLSDYQV